IDKQFIDANVIITTLEGLCSISMLAERELIFNHILDHTDLVIIDEADSALCRLDQIFAPSIGVNKYIQANVEIQNEYGRRSINNKVDADERTFVETMSEFAKALTEIWTRIKNVSTGFSKSRLRKFTALQLLNLLHEDVEQLTTEEKLPPNLWNELYKLASPKLTNNQVNLLSLAFNTEVSWIFKLEFIGYNINQFGPITQKKIQFIIMLIAFDQLYRKLSGLVRANNSLPISTKQLLNQSFIEHQKWLCSAPIGNMLAFETKEDDLVITKQFATGRSLALKFPWLKVDESGKPLGPNVLLMSGTSFAPKSYMNHINIPVNYIIEAEKYKRDYISKTQFVYSRSDIRVSGAEDEDKNENLKKLLNENIDIILNLLQSGNNILMIVNKYEQAEYVVKQLNKFLVRHGYSNVSIALKSDSNNTVSEQYLTRSKVKTFDNRILVAPAIAIERGHNIVDKFGNSKFDTLIFLVRPMNDPTDHGLHVKKVNGYIMTKYNNDVYKASVNTYTEMRKDAFVLYSKLTANKYGLNQLDKELQEDITATLFVMLIQIFGRLCRISDESHIKTEPLKVYFLDGAFRAKSQKGYDFLGELLSYLEELIEDPLTGNIAKTLYEPIYIGLKGGNI
ncbi:MAG: hypothetical protein ACRCSG_01180, partial [Cellulosilyticaceae bacterium]